MKNILILLLALLFVSATSVAQFNRSFFDFLDNYKVINIPVEKKGLNYGIATNYGALGVCLSNSAGKTVHWVKTDLKNQIDYYDANFLSTSFSPTAVISAMHEENNQQWILVTEKPNSAQQGIHIQHFANYTQVLNHFHFPTNFENKLVQTYARFGKFFITFINQNKELRLLKVDQTTLNLDANMLLESNCQSFDLNTRNSPSTFMYFDNEQNFQVYFVSENKLKEIRIVANAVESITVNPNEISRLIGFDEMNKQFIVLNQTPNQTIGFFESLNTTIFSEVTQETEYNTGISSPFLDYMHTTNGTSHFFVPNNATRKFLEINANGTVVTFQKGQNDLEYRNLTTYNGQPLVFGVIDDLNDLLFISHGSPNQILKFQEYGGVHSLSAISPYLSTGNQLHKYNFYSESTFRNYMSELQQRLVISYPNEEHPMYGSSSTFRTTFKPGPFTNSNAISHPIVDQYNKNLEVNVAMVNTHVSAIQANDPNYIIPFGILHWPGNGNTAIGQVSQIAPYADLNQNEIYEPQLGEYPLFPGDACVFNCSHFQQTDPITGHQEGIEMHTYFYTFNCADTVEDILFIKTELFERKPSLLEKEISFGVFADFDLGNPFDDFVGTHVDLGLIYAYNADANDESYSNFHAFNDSIPAIGIQFLKGGAFAPNNQDDEPGISVHQTVNGFGFQDGITDNEHKGLEFSNFYFEGTNQNDPIPIFEQLNGNLPEPQRYIFVNGSDSYLYNTAGVTDPINDLSEISANSTVGNRRILGSFGKSQFLSNQKTTYDFAVLKSKRMLGNLETLDALFAKAQHTRSIFQANETSCGQQFSFLDPQSVTSIAEETMLEFSVFPNPTSEKITLKWNSSEKTTIQLFDLQGKLIRSEQHIENGSQLSLATIPSGLYLVKLTIGNFTQTARLSKLE